MWEKNELPADVIAELKNARKVEAIKRLRMQRSLGLAEAKEQVDLYMADHPELQRRSQHRELNLIPLVLAAAVAVVAYVAFEML